MLDVSWLEHQRTAPAPDRNPAAAAIATSIPSAAGHGDGSPRLCDGRPLRPPRTRDQRQSPATEKHRQIQAVEDLQQVHVLGVAATPRRPQIAQSPQAQRLVHTPRARVRSHVLTPGGEKARQPRTATAVQPSRRRDTRTGVARRCGPARSPRQRRAVFELQASALRTGCHPVLDPSRASRRGSTNTPTSRRQPQTQRQPAPTVSPGRDAALRKNARPACALVRIGPAPA